MGADLLSCSSGSAYSEVGLLETCLAYLSTLLNVSQPMRLPVLKLFEA